MAEISDGKSERKMTSQPFNGMHHFFWFLISSSSFDTLADRFCLHGQEHRTSGYLSLCNCGDYREDIQDVSLTISISLKAFLKSF